MMAVETARIDCVFCSLRDGAVSFESGIGLSQGSSTEQPTRNVSPVEKLCASHPAPYVNSRLCFGTRNENVRMTASSVDTDCDTREFSWVISKLVRHPWTESTEFTELWSDIPSKSVNCNPVGDHGSKISENCDTSASNVIAGSIMNSSTSLVLCKYPWTVSTEFTELWSNIPSKSVYCNPVVDQRQQISENAGISVTNVTGDSNIDSSKSLVLGQYPWTVSTEFVELWSDIPRKFDASHNRLSDWEQLMQRNVISSSHVTVPFEDVSDDKQHLATTSAICRNSYTDLENITDKSNIAPHDSIYSNYPEQDRVACNRLFSKCFVIGLVMKILLSLIPLSAVYMGAVHIGTCPANEGATYLVYIAGITGMFLAVCHIAHHIMHHFRLDWNVNFKLGINTFQTITGILLTIEMILFYSVSTSFENSENYCNETFYNFTFYMNFAAAGIVFLSVLLQCVFSKHQVDNETF